MKLLVEVTPEVATLVKALVMANSGTVTEVKDKQPARKPAPKNTKREKDNETA